MAGSTGHGINAKKEEVNEQQHSFTARVEHHHSSVLPGSNCNGNACCTKEDNILGVDICGASSTPATMYAMHLMARWLGKVAVKAAVPVAALLLITAKVSACSAQLAARLVDTSG